MTPAQDNAVRFDAERRLGHRHGLPVPPDLDVAGCRFVLGDAGQAVGALGDAPFPKNKLLTPLPTLCFSGELHCGDRTLDVDGWHGLQGHNWGTAHAHTYAWGQCVFTDGDGEPHSEHGGALEFLRRDADPRFLQVV